MATLNVTITEELTLNGADRGSTNTLAIASVTQVYHRIATCPADSDTTVATFQTATSTSDNAIDLEDAKYVRITNLDASNPVNLSLQTSGGEDGTVNMSTTLLLAAGRSYVMGAVHDGIAMDDDAAGIVTALTDLESILIDPGSNAVSMEVFIAS
tara:strand:+ start:7320 stop:7784 length:465 start_codon:yes stop_codon:yes gene_type:complete